MHGIEVTLQCTNVTMHACGLLLDSLHRAAVPWRVLDSSSYVLRAIDLRPRQIGHAQRRIAMETLDGKLILTLVIVVALLMLSGLIVV